MNSKMTAILFLLLIPPLCGFASDKQEQFSSAIEGAKRVYYSGRTDEALAAVSALDAMSETFEQSDPLLSGSESSVLKSDYLLYKGLLLIELNEEQKASDVLSEGILFCENEYNRGGELFFLVQAALMKSHWMLLQKTSVLIKTGGEIQDMTDAALETDNDNFTARLLSAQGLINAPPLFGGDPEEAARLLLSSENLTADDYDRFDLYLTLADARRKKKEWNEAARWCLKSLSIFPDNRNALEMQDLIRRKKK